MSRCELSGKGPVVKNLVSHSNIKTKSTAQPNIQKKTLYSQTLNANVKLNVATSTIRSMEHMGGFDAFILRQDEERLSKRASKVRKQIRQRLSRPPKAKKAAAQA